jgi:hypothetical protein
MQGMHGDRTHPGGKGLVPGQDGDYSLQRPVGREETERWERTEMGEPDVGMVVSRVGINARISIRGWSAGPHKVQRDLAPEGAE